MNPTALQIREHILRVSQASGHGHIPTCFSVVELLVALYGTLRHRPQEPLWPERDVFVLSKGHAALALYSTLAHCGYFPPEDVFSFGAHGSRFGCHADRLKVPGIEASTGSLGHGIGLAAGMALAFQMEASPRQAYTLIGDGESNEGSVWEAIMVAAHRALAPLTVLYDDNGSQSRCLPVDQPAGRFRSFGCTVTEVDGHDVAAVQAALRTAHDTVHVIVAHTQKGHGCKTLMADMFAWHRRSPTPAELQQLLGELHDAA
jgi:transketolase